jgi:enoyl-CoA hydratase/carnithine racemase
MAEHEYLATELRGTFTGASVALHVGRLALASDLVQTGRRMSASEALARGILTSVVARLELENEAKRVAATLVQKDAVAFAANKQWLNRGLKIALAEARSEHERHRSNHR